MNNHSPTTKAIRREPPAFRQVSVTRATFLTPHLRRITLRGDELRGLVIEEPAASVRLLIPSSGTRDLVIPEWNGNEFLLPGGHRPLIRTFTPRHLRSDSLELDLDVVLHGEVGASGWAAAAQPGDPAAVSGPGRGYSVDLEADTLMLLGDATALAAIAQLLETVPPKIQMVVHIEVAHPDARLNLPGHPEASVTWHDLATSDPPGATLLSAIEGEPVGEGTRVWVAGEAAGVQRIRKHLAGREVNRSHTTVRGYWKVGRAGPG